MEAAAINAINDKASDSLERQINVDMKDIVLTPMTCSSLVNEILKALLYQKYQIPYPYQWLKTSLCKKKTDPNLHPHNVTIAIQKYYNIANSAFKAVEDVMLNLTTMLSSSISVVQEIVILFGSTPYTPKEVYTIRLPIIAKGHHEQNHRTMLQRKQHTILKNIFFSDEWLAAMQHQLPTTNTFIMVKKAGVLRHEDTYFEHYNNFVVPSSIRNTVITLQYDKKYDACCDKLRIFNDYHDQEHKTLPATALPLKNVEWYQAKGIVKGFKDFFIEKVSVSELW